jgi:hypothetical protein
MAQKKKPYSKLQTPTTLEEMVQLSKNVQAYTLEWLAFKCIDPLVIEQILAVSTNTLKNWDKKNILRTSRVERRRYIDGFDVLQMLEKGKQRPPQQ